MIDTFPDKPTRGSSRILGHDSQNIPPQVRARIGYMAESHPLYTWMRIGEISQRTGVTPDLLRAWERRYALLRPRRTDGRTRLYSAADETRVRLWSWLVTGRIERH